MINSRQGHLMRVFDPDHADMGLFTRVFIESVLNSKNMNHVIAERVDPWPDIIEVSNKKKIKRKIKNTRFVQETKNSFNKLGFLKRFTLKSNESLKKVRKKEMGPLSINWDTALSIQRYTAQFFFQSNHTELKIPSKQCPAKDKKAFDADFLKNAVSVFSKGDQFIKTPSIIITEAIVSMQQLMDWACMHCKEPDQTLEQMQAMLEPTIEHPFTKKMISPVEMLGQGNNSYIAQGLAFSFPTHVGSKMIIRNATKDDRSIIHPDFIKTWFDRDLEIGGCPALTHRNRAGEIFMDFAKMYVDVAQRIKNYKDEAFQPKIETGQKLKVQ